MAIVRWDPGRDLDTLQGDMNRLFDSFFGRREAGQANAVRRWVPPMDLAETDDQLVLRADLPGMERDDIDIEVKDNVLTISGERKAEHEKKGEGFHRIERSFGRFSRSLGLPRGIDAKSVTANFENGVLEVRMPKPEERKATRVEIATEARAHDGGTEAVEVESGGESAGRPTEHAPAGAAA
ncbi:MAG TPA: Hsp20/alpha crystallin family protein [Solirubrobacterales bacterium]|nr:Hsp20/alpha crystallin family protein [Solirubrobacterales bacterium]